MCHEDKLHRPLAHRTGTGIEHVYALEKLRLRYLLYGATLLLLLYCEPLHCVCVCVRLLRISSVGRSRTRAVFLWTLFINHHFIQKQYLRAIEPGHKRTRYELERTRQMCEYRYVYVVTFRMLCEWSSLAQAGEVAAAWRFGSSFLFVDYQMRPTATAPHKFMRQPHNMYLNIYNTVKRLVLLREVKWKNEMHIKNIGGTYTKDNQQPCHTII